MGLRFEEKILPYMGEPRLLSENTEFAQVVTIKKDINFSILINIEYNVASKLLN